MSTEKSTCVVCGGETDGSPYCSASCSAKGKKRVSWNSKQIV